MKNKRNDANIWQQYEREKKRLQRTSTTPEQYQREIQKLTRRLGV